MVTWHRRVGTGTVSLSVLAAEVRLVLPVSTVTLDGAALAKAKLRGTFEQMGTGHLAWGCGVTWSPLPPSPPSGPPAEHLGSGTCFPGRAELC